MQSSIMRYMRVDRSPERDDATTEKGARPGRELSGGCDYGFVDLFCGIGGASEGARMAGLNVVLAVDSNEKLLAIHMANHPHALHACRRLPSMIGVRLPTGGRWHLHGSPPCTQLSTANQGCSIEMSRDGLSLVRWFLQFALQSKATTWSMEQVPVGPVKREVERAKREYPDSVDYCVVDCVALGVPQHRRRLFAGTPHLIGKLKRRRVASKAVSDFISEPRGTHTRLESCSGTVKKVESGVSKRVIKRYTWKELCRSVSEACCTITASNGLRWANPRTDEVPFQMTEHELKALQTFPAEYKLDRSKTLSVTGVGNAVPPLAMKELLLPLMYNSAD